MSNLFLEKVKLESTEVLGSYTDAQPIPHHYGDLRTSWVSCYRVTAQLWLVGAHPWQQITRCRVGGKLTAAFEPYTREDTDGVVRQYVRLSVPPSNDSFTVEVSGLAKVSPINGKLLENPDEIIQDIAALCGRELAFPLFREACSERRLKIAGSVDERLTLRAYVQDILQSCGAVWLGSNAVFHPDSLISPLPIEQPSNVREYIELIDVCGRLDIYYNWNQAKGWNGSYMQLVAQGCQYNRSGEIYAKWLRHQRDAERLGRALLGKRAGQYVKVQALLPGRVDAGTVVSLAGVSFPGSMLVLSAEASDVETQVEGEVLLETYPLINVSRFTTEESALRGERVDVTIFDTGECEITVFDSQNRPMAGVQVTLDNSVTQTTDERGIVTMFVAKGDHTLRLSGSDIESHEPYPLSIP